MTVTESLSLLDPQNDEHWTQDGAPRVDVVSDLTGRTVTRAEIVETAPLFTRTNPQLEPDDLPDDDNPEVKIASTEEEEASPVEEEVPQHIKNVLAIKEFRERQQQNRRTRVMRRNEVLTELNEKLRPGEQLVDRAPIDRALASRRRSPRSFQK